ncbi:hypothetical protein IF2G_09521 [Cordyceps javanica]|nr:hypothetical protein IF2G_09521 [Cordyceps javanica]
MVHFSTALDLFWKSCSEYACPVTTVSPGAHHLCHLIVRHQRNAEATGSSGAATSAHESEKREEEKEYMSNQLCFLQQFITQHGVCVAFSDP